MTEPLKPSLRITGGNPAGLENFRPMNPHGAAMPKPKRLMPSPREGKAPEVDLYQIHVITRKGADLRIGPKAPRGFLEPLMVTINGLISTGREKDWTEPHLVPAEPMVTA